MYRARILIIYHDEILAESMRTFLRRHAGDVRIASDADSAMVILNSFTPDVVPLD
jgi:DNA-binding response OmpR family regulator